MSAPSQYPQPQTQAQSQPQPRRREKHLTSCTIRLTDTQAARRDQLAAALGLTNSDLLRRALDAFAAALTEADDAETGGA